MPLEHPVMRTEREIVVMRPSSYTLATSATAAPRPPDRRGRRLPAPGGADDPHAHGGPRPPRGPGPAVRRAASARALAAAARPALPPEARGPAVRARPPAVGRRPGVQPRLPRTPHRAAAARRRRRPAPPHRPAVRPAARPHEAAVG